LTGLRARRAPCHSSVVKVPAPRPSPSTPLVACKGQGAKGGAHPGCTRRGARRGEAGNPITPRHAMSRRRRALAGGHPAAIGQASDQPGQLPELRGTLVSDAPLVVRCLGSFPGGTRPSVPSQSLYLPDGMCQGHPGFALPRQTCPSASYTSRRPSRACDRVPASAYSTSPPEGRPRARRVTLIW